MNPKFDKNALRTILREQQKMFDRQDLGIERELLSKVSRYAKSPHVVVISGLRRVGKSTLIGQIAKKQFQDKHYYINFEDERFINFKAGDFDILHELLVELFGEKRVFFLDEIQNVDGWERFVRRLSDEGYKFYITGSNASLLSQELGTKLTGRYLLVELFPFSFTEFLIFKNKNIPEVKSLTAVERGQLKRLFNSYLTNGGIPDALKYPKLLIHKILYDDVLYRDITARYKIDSVKELKELSFYLMSNIASLVSYNKLREMLKLGSVNTIKSFVEHLETSWLFFVVNVYAYSVKKQQIAAKKAYGIDTGLVRSVGFSFSANKGKLLENLVFLILRQRYKDIYYFKTKNNLEVDFYIPDNRLLVQSSYEFTNEKTRKRELSSLQAALKETKDIKKGLILTQDTKEMIKLDKFTVEVKPVYEWLLEK